MGVCALLDFDDIMLIYCLGYDFYIYGAFDCLFNSIVNLWSHIWNHSYIRGVACYKHFYSTCCIM